METSVTREPIKIGKSYIFDILAESNMSVDTCVVTTIKKANKPNKWIVLSVNTGDVFETPEELLTPFELYDTFAPVIRCQYGTTDFYQIDVGLIDYLAEMIAPKAKTDEKFESIYMHAKALRDKVQKYALISDYKFKLETICNAKQQILNPIQKVHENPSGEMSKRYVHRDMFNFDPSIISKFMPKAKIDINDPNEAITAVPIEAFVPNVVVDIRDVFEELAKINDMYYGEENIPARTFVSKFNQVLKTIPPEVLSVPDYEGGEMTFEDLMSHVKFVATEAMKQVRSDKIVFLAGLNKNTDKVAVFTAGTEDGVKSVFDFFELCYDLSDENNTFENKILMIVIPKRHGRRKKKGGNNNAKE